MKNKGPITTHILDLERGKPASKVKVELEFESRGKWATLGKGQTNSDGRITDLLPAQYSLKKGNYRLRFHTQKRSAFFSEILIAFQIKNPNENYHVPLLLSGYGYSTYRGS